MKQAGCPSSAMSFDAHRADNGGFSNSRRMLVNCFHFCANCSIHLMVASAPRWFRSLPAGVIGHRAALWGIGAPFVDGAIGGVAVVLTWSTDVPLLIRLIVEGCHEPEESATPLVTWPTSRISGRNFCSRKVIGARLELFSDLQAYGNAIAVGDSAPAGRRNGWVHQAGEHHKWTGTISRG